MLQLLIDVVVDAALVVALVWVGREVLAGVRPAGPRGWGVLRSRDGWRQLRWAHDLVVTVVVLAATAYSLALVLGSPFKGMADNGDDERQMYQLGIAAPAAHPLSSGYVTEYYRTGLARDQLPIPATLAHSSFLFHYYYGYPTSALPLIRLALLGHDIVGGRLLDLRWVGFVNVSVVLLGLIGLAIASRQLPRVPRWIAVALVALAFSDPGYLLSMNSFLSEPSSIGFAVLALGSAAAVPVAGYRRLAFVSFVLGTCAFSFALTGDALVALPLAVAAVPLAWRATRPVPGVGEPSASAPATPPPRTPARELHRAPAVRSRTRFAPLAAAGGIAILAAAVLSVRGDLPYFTEIHEYDGVFSGILAHTSHPRAALRALGLPVSLAKYAGIAAFLRAKSAFAKPFIQREFFAHISLFAIVAFYLTHPLEFWRLCRYGAGLAFHLRLHYLANFAPGGPTGPYDIDSLWTLVHRDVLPHTLAFILALAVAALVVAGRWGWAQWRRRGFASPWAAPEVLAATAIGGLIAFVEPLVAEGNVELVKHEAVFNVCTDVQLAILLALVAAAIQWRITGRRPTPVGLPVGMLARGFGPRGSHQVLGQRPVPASGGSPGPPAGVGAGGNVSPGRASTVPSPPARRFSLWCPVCDAEVPAERVAHTGNGWLLSCPACGVRTRLGAAPGSAEAPGNAPEPPTG